MPDTDGGLLNRARRQPWPTATHQRAGAVTDVLSLDPLVVLDDGRAGDEDALFEVTGVGTGRLGGPLEPWTSRSLRSPFWDGAARDAMQVPVPDGSVRSSLDPARPGWRARPGQRSGTMVSLWCSRRVSKVPPSR